MIYYKLAQYAEASQYAKIACINDHDHAPARRLLDELKQRCLSRPGGNAKECMMYENVPKSRP
jgi:hypothetical protein